jgi:type I restriction enzyme S subunit
MKYSYVELKDICNYEKARISSEEINDKNYISTENMVVNKGGVVEASSLPSLEQVCAFCKGHVLVSNIRPYFKKIWFADKQGGCSNDVLVFSANKKCLPEMLYYILCDDNFFDYATVTSKGTKMPRGDKNAIMKYKVPLIPLNIQEKIVTLLINIDKKIRLNKQLNDNLEEQIRLLFNKYYESADNENVLSECCTLTSSKRVFAKDYVQEGVSFYRGKEITLKRNGKSITDILYISEENYEEIKNKYGVPNIGDILLTAVGTLGNSYMVQEEKFYFKDGNIIWLKDFRSNEENYYIYDYMQSSLFSNAIDSIRIGSTQSALTIVSLGKLKVLLPNESQLKEYYNISKTIRDRINANIKETENLSKLRDTLLPKLLSGELDLTNVEVEG